MYAEETVFSFVVFGLFLGLIFGAVGVAIARNKGISTVAGFWWGALLGPFGCIIVALLNPTPPQPPVPKAPPSSEPGDPANADYQIWLVTQYSIQKNDVLGKYYCDGQLYETVEQALERAHSLESQKRQIEKEQIAREEESRIMRLAEIEAADNAARERKAAEVKAAKEKWQRWKYHIVGGTVILFAAIVAVVWKSNEHAQQKAAVQLARSGAESAMAEYAASTAGYELAESEGVKEARSHDRAARQEESAGELARALDLFRQAERGWQLGLSAIGPEIARIDSERAAAQSERERVAAAEAAQARATVEAAARERARAQAQAEAEAVAKAEAAAAAKRAACARTPSCLVDAGGGVLRQQATGLDWTQSDNGHGINLTYGRAWCASKGTGWRLPSSDELLSIFYVDASGSVKTSCGHTSCFVSPLFRLTESLFWSGDTTGSSVELMGGGRFSIGFIPSHRVLFVRGVPELDAG